MLESSKRLQLLVRSDGRILTFKADPAVLTQVFGQDAATLNKKARGGSMVRQDPWMVVTARTSTVPVPIFGIIPSAMPHPNAPPLLPHLQMLSELVPDLAPPPGFQGGWPSEGQLLRQLSAHASEAAGKWECCWAKR